MNLEKTIQNIEGWLKSPKGKAKRIADKIIDPLTAVIGANAAAICAVNKITSAVYDKLENTPFLLYATEAAIIGGAAYGIYQLNKKIVPKTAKYLYKRQGKERKTLNWASYMKTIFATGLLIASINTFNHAGKMMKSNIRAKPKYEITQTAKTMEDQTIENKCPKEISQREDYKLLPLFMQRQYRAWKKHVEKSERTLSLERAQLYTEYKIRVSDFFSIPLEDLIGIAAHESYFVNRDDDENISVKDKDGKLIKNPSASIYNIGYISQIDRIKRKQPYLERKGYDFSKLPEEMRPLPYTIDLNKSPQRAATEAGIYYAFYYEIGKVKGYSDKEARDYAIRRWNGYNKQYLSKVEQEIEKYRKFKEDLIQQHKTKQEQTQDPQDRKKFLNKNPRHKTHSSNHPCLSAQLS